MPRSLRHCRSPCARLSYPHPHPLPTAPSQRHGYQFTGCVAARVVALRQIRCRAVSLVTLVSPCGATHLCAWQNCVKRANCLLLSKLARAFKLITWTNWIVRSSSACCSSVFSLSSLFAVLSVPLSLFPRHYHHQCFVVLCDGVRDLQSKRSTHVHNVRHEARAASRAWPLLPLPPPPSMLKRKQT